MVHYYTLFGQKVGSHVLSIATLGSTGFAAWFFTRGKKEVGNKPPINASDKTEESFVKDFIAKKEANGAKH